MSAVDRLGIPVNRVVNLRHACPTMRRLVLDLRAERVRQGRTQQALADDVGVGMGTLCQWERGVSTPMMPLLVRWARALGMEIRLQGASRA